MFQAHDFSNERLYWPRARQTVNVAVALDYQIMYRRTIVGWVNVYLIDHPDRPCVNLSPEAFHAILPGIDPRTAAGCREVDFDTLQELGFTVEGIEEVAV